MIHINLKEEWVKEIIDLNEEDKKELLLWLIEFSFVNNVVIPTNKNIQDLCLRMIIYWANHTSSELEV